LRIVTGTISHETNVLSPIKTNLDEFRKRQLLLDEEVIEFFRDTNTPVGGFLDGCMNYGWELIPTVYASATPSGTITADTFETLLGYLLDRIEDSKPFDGVLLHLHGAGVSEEFPDIEGKILEAVRNMIGEKPLISTFDLHANFTPTMIDNADILIAYDTYPHVDGYDRAIEAVALMKKILEGDLIPTKAFRQTRMMPALQAQFTGRYPMNKIIELIHRMEKAEEVETISVCPGFPWSDISDTGMSFTVHTNNNQGLAEELADELEYYAWNMRRDFLVRPMPVNQALRRVELSEDGPIVLADIGDNSGGGAPSDGTLVLRAVLEKGLEGGVFSPIADPDVVTELSESDIGEKVTVTLGGKTDKLHGEPLEITGSLKLVSDGKWKVKGPMGTGSQVDMGKTLVLNVGGNDIIVTTKRLQPTDLELYRSQGIEPSEKKFIVVKSSVHYRAAHEPIAKEVIELDTPGLTSPRLAGFNFKNIRHPIFPLDIALLGITELKDMEEE
jgi:microcystin degradation protein MlrC